VGAGGAHQRQGQGRSAGAGDCGETTGCETVLRAAVLTLCRHGEFLSGACEVSCRVRIGDVRPSVPVHVQRGRARAVNGTRTASPLAAPERNSGAAAYLVPPLLPREFGRVLFPDGGRIGRSIRIGREGNPAGPHGTSREFPDGFTGAGVRRNSGHPASIPRRQRPLPRHHSPLTIRHSTSPYDLAHGAVPDLASGTGKLAPSRAIRTLDDDAGDSP
jgi:hypothetical protein